MSWSLVKSMLVAWLGVLLALEGLSAGFLSRIEAQSQDHPSYKCDANVAKTPPHTSRLSRDLAKEDRLIVEGILHEENLEYSQSIQIFLQLYTRTGKVEYLIRASREAMITGEKHQLLISKLLSWLHRYGDSGEDFRAARVLIDFYVRSKEVNKAEKIVDRWLSKSTDPKDIKRLARIKFAQGNYTEVLGPLQRSYAKTGDESVLLLEAILLQEYLHKSEKAIDLLESHLRMQGEGSGKLLYFELIELYAQQKRLDKVLETYKKIYEKEPKAIFLQKIVKLSLSSKDFSGLSRFLEKHSRGNEKLLYMLYREQKEYEKATALAKRRYEETGQARWLGKEAISIFEGAEAKKKMTPEVIKKFRFLFDRALKEGLDESIYLNYYGYILIDEGWDLERGLNLVRKALREQPKDPYSLDSLAWGLYKKGACKEAYQIMQRVLGTSEMKKEPEIKKHWEKIQNCQQADHASE